MFRSQWKSSDEPVIGLTVVDQDKPSCIDLEARVVSIPQLLKTMTSSDLYNILGYDGYDADLSEDDIFDNITSVDDNQADIVDVFTENRNAEALLKKNEVMSAGELPKQGSQADANNVGDVKNNNVASAPPQEE
ncbi:hypothetical protein [Peromfec virus RodF8_60]|uniref:Uncharacterized protein n=1 Tax=Peromfec virus RodF8_60 TaxID=2929386 RepID=A0A976N2G3_9VIRU|nr:hypothetical protein [Peromfec virus RodF8_60]